MYDLLCLENKEAREVKMLVSIRGQIMLVCTKDCFIFITTNDEFDRNVEGEAWKVVQHKRQPKPSEPK